MLEARPSFTLAHWEICSFSLAPNQPLLLAGLEHARGEAVVAIATNYAKQTPPATTPAANDFSNQINSTTQELGMLGLPLGWPSCAA